MLALDHKLVTLKNVFYNVKGEAIPSEQPHKKPKRKKNVLDEFLEPESEGSGRPKAPAITGLKRVQASNPITINDASKVAVELEAWCDKHALPTMHLRSPVLPDVALGKRLGIRILIIATAFQQCIDNDIFEVFEALASNYEIPFIAACGRRVAPGRRRGEGDGRGSAGEARREPGHQGAGRGLGRIARDRDRGFSGQSWPGRERAREAGCRNAGLMTGCSW